MSKETHCAICHTGENLVPLECQHEFHQACIDQWFKRSRTCPVCRKSYGVLIDIEQHSEPNQQANQQHSEQQLTVCEELQQYKTEVLFVMLSALLIYFASTNGNDEEKRIIPGSILYTSIALYFAQLIEVWTREMYNQYHYSIFTIVHTIMLVIVHIRGVAYYLTMMFIKTHLMHNWIVISYVILISLRGIINSVKNIYYCVF